MVFRDIIIKCPIVQWFILGLLAALIVFIRPTNLLFVSLALLLEVRSWRTLKQRLKRLIQVRPILIAVCSVALVAPTFVLALFIGQLDLRFLSRCWFLLLESP